MRKEANGTQKQINAYLQASFALGWLCKNAENNLSAISASTGGEVPVFELAGRMGEYLLSQAGGSSLGLENTLPSLRRETKSGSETVATVKVVSNSHKPSQVKAKPRLSTAGRKAISKGVKKFWANKKASGAKAKKHKLVAKTAKKFVKESPQKRAWDSLTEGERQARIKRMVAARNHSVVENLQPLVENQQQKEQSIAMA